VVVGGSLPQPEIVANKAVELLGRSERFCFHAAAEMKLNAAEEWIERMRERALVNARRGLSPLMAKVSVCAIVAKEGQPENLSAILASHPRIHAAEGYFYRDVFREACGVPVNIVPPSSLDVSKVGKLAAPPWGRDQKLAALAAWSALEFQACSSRLVPRVGTGVSND
jgi:hypothetical protein